MPTTPTANEAGDLQRIALEIARAGSTEGGSFRLSVAGSSMSPTFKNGDVVFVQPGGASGIRPGALITFLTDGGPITHRVVALRMDHLITKGDNARSLDPAVGPDRVVGQVVAGIRDGVRVEIRPGGRDGIIARLSLMEGNLTGRFAPEFRQGWWFRLVNLPLRLMVAAAAFPRLSR